MRTITLIFLSVNLFFGVANFCETHKITKRSVYPAYEYQIQLNPDSTYIYSDGVLIGTIKSWKPGIDSTIKRWEHDIDTTIWYNNK